MYLTLVYVSLPELAEQPHLNTAAVACARVFDFHEQHRSIS